MKLMTKEINATINVKILDEDLTIDDICSPLEEQGWMIQSAFIRNETMEGTN